jgi:diaminopimelate epimerase
MGQMPVLTLTKHHGLGNDFLVLLDMEKRRPVNPELARALCDRRRGVGADGVIRVTPGRKSADVTFELRNADGSEAEISGNGMRCMAQAVVDAGVAPGPELVVATIAGRRRVTVEPETLPGLRRASVDMGPARIGPDQPQEVEGRRARTVDMGNPHLVLVGPDPAIVNVAVIGAQAQAAFTGGVNVEFVMVGPELDAITLRVWERGVGETLACGSGACAAAAALHEWGLVGPHVTVHQLGGDAEVDVKDGGVVLSGPTQRICRVEVDL